MNKLILIALLAICAIAAASWTWIEEEGEERPAVASKFDYPEDAATTTLAAPAFSAVAMSAEVSQVQKCTGCTAYGTKTCQGKVCFKKCISYGPISCPSGNTLSYHAEDEDAEYTYALAYKPADYITDLAVVAGSEGIKCPDGYTKIWVDLNQRAGGKYIYLCTRKEVGKTPVTDITVVKAGKQLYENSCPSGYTFIDVDLNQKAGGKYMYFCYKKAQSGSPLVQVSFAIGKNKACPSGFKRNSNDLNEGAGGDYIYLCHKYDGDAIDEIVLSNVKYDISKLIESDAAVKSVDSIEVDNPTTSAVTGPTLSGSFSVTSTKSWSTTNSVSVGVKLTLKTGVPLTGWEKSIEISTSYTYSTTTGGSISETSQKGYSFSCVADAKTITRCDAQYRQATIDVPYTASALYKYKDGKQSTKSFSGIYKGVSVSAVRMRKSVVHLYK